MFVPYLRHSFGWSVADISWGSAITEIMVTIVSLLAGVLLDRYGARRMILLCIPAFGLAFAAMSLLGGSLWQFHRGYALLPLIGVGVLPGAWVKVTAGWFDRRLGLAIAVATLGIGFGARSCCSSRSAGRRRRHRRRWLRFRTERLVRTVCRSYMRHGR